MKKQNVWNQLHIVECGVYLFMLTAITLVLAVLVFRAIEIESDWRSGRMCDQGYYCDERAGPR